MNPRIINQGDAEWANLPYRDLPYTVVKEGCGLCAVTMCAMELGKYWDYTPLDTIDYMRQFATNGDGTLQSGISAGLDKYLGNHTLCYVGNSMQSAWDELNQGDRIGIILFGADATGPDLTEWTKGGHYVMFGQYKYENGEHWFYTKDSSYRHNDGWHSYERSMRGCIPSYIWTAKIMKNGWKEENGSWYFYKDGVKAKNEWAQDTEGKWYYLGSNGKMVKSSLIEWKGDKYYLQSDGAMASSKWVKFKVGWRYFNKSGKMLKSRMFKYNGDFYYLKSTGVMATGKVKITCDFGTDGKLIVK